MNEFYVKETWVENLIRLDFCFFFLFIVLLFYSNASALMLGGINEKEVVSFSLSKFMGRGKIGNVDFFSFIYIYFKIKKKKKLK